MSEASQVYTFNAVSTFSALGDWFRIEQKDFNSQPKTEFAFQQWLVAQGYATGCANYNVQCATQMAELREQYFGACGGGDGRLFFDVNVHRNVDRANYDYSRKDYELWPSWGRFSSYTVVVEERDLYLEVNMTDKVQITDYKVLELKRPKRTTTRVGSPSVYFVVGRWQGLVFNQYGQNVSDGHWSSAPDTGTWDADTQTITFDEPLFGTFKVTVEVIYHNYKLMVNPRGFNAGHPDLFNADKVYESDMMAVWKDSEGNPGFVRQALEIPESAASCIPYAYNDEGFVEIVPPPPSDGGMYDTDGDGVPDTYFGNDGADGQNANDPCTCWDCGGDGITNNCTPSAAVDCTCPTCEGTGVLPGCEDGDSDQYTYYYYTNYGSGDGSDGGGDGDGEGYTLRITKHKCTGEITNYEVIRNS